MRPIEPSMEARLSPRKDRAAYAGETTIHMLPLQMSQEACEQPAAVCEGASLIRPSNSSQRDSVLESVVRTSCNPAPDRVLQA